MFFGKILPDLFVARNHKKHISNRPPSVKLSNPIKNSHSDSAQVNSPSDEDFNEVEDDDGIKEVGLGDSRVVIPTLGHLVRNLTTTSPFFA
ncbi:hypothetical protein SK128_010569 [Halocaridina rubra]|uniref:Uncharacterized protein n=1 Tax=Halocaridina rubra TaxID=373956 RepID=A0AAN8XEQ8_HALRR